MYKSNFFVFNSENEILIFGKKNKIKTFITTVKNRRYTTVYQSACCSVSFSILLQYYLISLLIRLCNTYIYYVQFIMIFRMVIPLFLNFSCFKLLLFMNISFSPFPHTTTTYLPSLIARGCIIYRSSLQYVKNTIRIRTSFAQTKLPLNNREL